MDTYTYIFIYIYIYIYPPLSTRWGGSLASSPRPTLCASRYATTTLRSKLSQTLRKLARTLRPCEFCLAGSPMGQHCYLCSVLFTRAPVLGLSFFVSIKHSDADAAACRFWRRRAWSIGGHSPYWPSLARPSPPRICSFCVCALVLFAYGPSVSVCLHVEYAGRRI